MATEVFCNSVESVGINRRKVTAKISPLQVAATDQLSFPLCA
jgi:hypothetical protein